MKNFTCLIFIFVLSSYNLWGQEKTIPVINQQTAHTLSSEINETTYYLNVSLPQHYKAGDSIQYPVLYVLDGGMCFPVAHAARTSMDFYRGLEDLIIVGIQYDWERSFKPWFTKRWRDLTPDQDSLIDDNPDVRGILDMPTGTLTSGGASVFLQVLKNEIIPFIEKHYKTTSDRGISGHSFGGLFTTYCLFTAPDLFNKYGINSPSFWWHNKMMFDIEKAFSKEHNILNAEIFMSVGSLEGPSMTPLILEFEEILRSRGYEGLDLTTRVFEDETHTSVLPAMMSSTIKTLYGKK
ncbi:alpha/beta hydrolase-fold protein [Gaetbulibacter sp. M240]|uniref:alpha/beta hydrolase n=1 Tax=Gaetbulibacter sp. M240 TaxID=3126511 RepID=UPI00374FC3CF